MSHSAESAIDDAFSCEVRKIAWRQSKDGMCVTFVIHPDDAPDRLALAPLGQRYLLALVPLEDNDRPEPNEIAIDKLAEKPMPVTGSVQRAAVLCSDRRFQAFLQETQPAKWGLLNEGEPKERAAELVRENCGVKSRKEIVPGTPAYEKWNKLQADYEVWLRA